MTQIKLSKLNRQKEFQITQNNTLHRDTSTKYTYKKGTLTPLFKINNTTIPNNTPIKHIEITPQMVQQTYTLKLYDTENKTLYETDLDTNDLTDITIEYHTIK